MTFNKYFQDELAYLRELGAEFAQENPNLAPFLARDSNDPDVERLMEGFAFLSGRIRQKLDDELPEVAHSLIDLLWPHYLRPLPSMSVLQFSAIPGAVTSREVIPRGIYVDSAPVEGTSCRFRSCYDVALLPMEVADVVVETTATTSTLRLQMRLMEGCAFNSLELDHVRLYLNAERDPMICRSTYLWLCRHVREIQVRPAGGGRQAGFTLGPDAIQPVGFADEESLLPYPATSFQGYGLIQEYFLFPQKLMFLDITRLEATAGFEGTGMEIEIRFNQPLPDEVRLTRDHIKLNCTPIVNLFPRDGEPITLSREKVEYRVRASASNPLHYDIFSIDRVEGWVRGQGRRLVYPPFESFEGIGPEGSGSHSIYFRRRLRPSVTGRNVDTYISFVDGHDAGTVPPTETISLALTCTNGRLAELVPAGAVTKPTGNTPGFVSFRNIATVTPSYPPPIEQGMIWRLVSNMSLNYLSLVSVEALRVLLSAYDFRAIYDAQARRRLELMLDGIKEVQTRPTDWLVKGYPVRGIHVRIEIEESKMGGAGDVFLFGSVLDRFLTLYSSVNSLHRLTIHGIESNAEWQWQAKMGALTVL